MLKYAIGLPTSAPLFPNAEKINKKTNETTTVKKF